MTDQKTVEKQYQAIFELKKKSGLSSLGAMNSQVWNDDPRRLVFTLARYKFVAKMLQGKKNALEIGCGDAFGSRVVRQEVDDLTVIDIDSLFIEDATERDSQKWPLRYAVHNMLSGPYLGDFEAAYSLDVLEHIDSSKEDTFIQNVIKSLTPDGVVIIGMPSIESQQYASAQSKVGHVNCKSGNDFKKFLSKYFKQVFLFSMNDEVVHTGFYPMAHYLLALCTNPFCK